MSQTETKKEQSLLSKPTKTNKTDSIRDRTNTACQLPVAKHVRNTRKTGKNSQPNI